MSSADACFPNRFPTPEWSLMISRLEKHTTVTSKIQRMHKPFGEMSYTGVDINEDRVVCISCSNQSLYFFVFLVFVFLARINLCIWKVSTWFANARRRLKKENKMTWEPKNKLDDEDVDVSDDDDRDHSFNRDDKSGGERKLQISAQH